MSINLNLARKWRSKNFEQIVEQDLCVRILKNGLYLNAFFPVYLFSGQRGCGKTSMARIFASAVNCHNLENFQKDPKNFIIPCGHCPSCDAMNSGKHPDFIEIDAASHTGVDNIRNIIEVSSLLPIMGRKKVYLIDEAHMLSKAAFNAFLKILEEPPASVLFILATTDVQKIIDTVRSRSLQLFFSLVSNNRLIQHLETICKHEEIPYEIDGLAIISRESQGSVRDAINLLEQVRFSNSQVTKSAVLNVLGHISDEYLLIFFDHLVNKRDIGEFLRFLDSINYNNFNAEFIWNRLLEISRIAIRIKHGVTLNSDISLDTSVDVNNIIFMLNEFCMNEIIFFKSINKNLFLELLCLKIIKPVNLTNNLTSSNKKPREQETIKTVQEENHDPVIRDHVNNEKENLWISFINEIKNINEPLIESVFTQAKLVNINQSGEVVISFGQNFMFFRDIINDNVHKWSHILNKYHPNATLKPILDESNRSNNIVKHNTENIKKVETLDIKVDTIEMDDLGNNLLKYFPGKITKVKQD